MEENQIFFDEESKLVGEIFLAEEEKVAKRVGRRIRRKGPFFPHSISSSSADCEEKEEAAFVCGCVGVCAISSLLSISVGVCVSECA